jgi:hypothetical protein
MLTKGLATTKVRNPRPRTLKRKNHAFAYKTHRGLSAQAPIGQSWAELAVEPTVQDVFSKTLALRDGQGTFGEIVYHLPILSVDIPNRGAPGSVLEGARPPGAYPLEQLSAVEFTQMC